MKIYKANRKGLINYLLMGSILLPVVIFFFDMRTFTESPLILLPFLSPSTLLFWIYVDTFYKIENHHLIYHSAFLRGKIEILTIKEIRKGETMWSGVKPALASKGLIIKYNKYDDVYLAPENNDEMIADLLEINPEIKLTVKH
ncbi:PH domain-containing protein [Belliella aquatica]|uniref:Uncharacterized protein YyaB-like PH domain-containing protein n=1 Tax=Belliella aquatica TaxID=1323734 RepID=A0ABQ1LM95_9BACT|nr:PH domain-containing protein [Belliella aquatica]MCH7404240.1 PH domain-containing protein [Belliella aquatica]GGC26487.1 hypothetical protein GCM10010993_01900 [Belliella aquatica]